MKEIPRNCYRMSIISSCNMKCNYCHNEGNTKVDMLTKDDIEKIVKDSEGFGLKEIRLTGGEPLIHPQIFDICKMLSEKYKLKISLNTNCIEIDKILYMIDKGWIDRVVVGLDYFDKPVSKDSKIGLSSAQILKNIISIRDKGCNVSISSVYTGDIENKIKMIEWAIKNNIRIKVLEIVKDEKEDSTSKAFLNLESNIKKQFNLKYESDQYNEVNGFLDNKRVITFFHSHCRIRECDICKEIHLRITASGKMKQCMYHDEDDIDTKSDDFRENLYNYINTPAKYY